MAKFDTIVFITSLISFLLFNLPITESDNWFNTVYYSSLAVTNILRASLIVVVSMLYKTAVNIIKSSAWVLRISFGGNLGKEVNN